MQNGPIPKGQRVFSCGHSFHMFVPPILNQIALAAGLHDHQIAGLSSIGGSRVIQHWDVPDDANQAKAALKAAKVDVLTLSPIWLPDAGMGHFAKLTAQHNPQARVLVQEYWLPNDTYEPVYPLEVGKVVDHNAAHLSTLRQCHDHYFRDIEDHVRGINQAIGRPTVLIVPVGQAVLPLREKIVAGSAPGLATQAELFTDSWGHVTLPIQVLSSYCHFAVIYRRSPVGLPRPTVMVEAGNPAWDDRHNRLLQELAWDAVRRHPMSGVTG